MGKINKMCVRMKQLWGDRFQGEKPSTVETLPLRISLENLMLTTACRKSAASMVSWASTTAHSSPR
jgi:hypothetical protein